MAQYRYVGGPSSYFERGCKSERGCSFTACKFPFHFALARSDFCLSFFHPRSGPRSETVYPCQRVTDRTYHQTSCSALHWGQEVVKEGKKFKKHLLGNLWHPLICERSQYYDGGTNSNLMRINEGLWFCYYDFWYNFLCPFQTFCASAPKFSSQDTCTTVLLCCTSKPHCRLTLSHSKLLAIFHSCYMVSTESCEHINCNFQILPEHKHQFGMAKLCGKSTMYITLDCIIHCCYKWQWIKVLVQGVHIFR